MATPRPLRCLRTLQRQCLQSQHPSSKPVRLFSTTSSSRQWRRAIQAPKDFITYEKYMEMMKKPTKEAMRLAMNPPLPQETLAIQRPTETTPHEAITQDPTTARLVPASPSYFSLTPHMADDIVHLAGLLRRHGTLPKLPTKYTPKVVWKTADEYSQWVGEKVSAVRYVQIKSMLVKLNMILPELRSQEVTDAINAHLKDPEMTEPQREPPALDEWGRGYGEGRRKTAKALAYVVEGSGEVLVNERNITEVFGRVKDRESALWPLTATGRMSRYNVFAVVRGGGTTGWAEAMALAVAKAVLVHEPGLKPAMRRAGCIRRDPRMVERKKPGHVKARKMPAWVKR